MGLGLALILWAVRWHRRTGQDPAPWKPSPSLLFVGPYRFTRNPMYVGMMALQIGVGMALVNAWVCFLAPASLWIVHWIAVLPEEAYLAQKFGEPYLRYKASVRRY